ncbi:exopolyphosphatase [Rhodobacterales bacterium LSUCC0031]|nr:exopolyphosphatase [Rhodobacterales bacterium LSUCC0031]
MRAEEADIHPEWGPFGVPLFDGPEAQSLSRVGVIDIGSNSVRMVIFDGAARSPAYFFNEKILCGLGAGFAETGRLHPEGKERALAALRRFARLAEAADVSPLLAVATAAVRDAADGLAFREQVKAETGLAIRVIDGAEEARLSAQGVLLGWPGAAGLICDIGGSSMELAELKGSGKVGHRATSDLGPLKLLGMTADKKALRAHIRSEVATLTAGFPENTERLFLVGGSWRAIARIDMERRGYPLKVLHEYRMTPRGILETLKYIAETDINALRASTGTSAERMRLVPVAAEVLRALVKTLQPSEIAVSSYGLREGLLYEQMSEALKSRDPLIEAARHSEAQLARMPGFGRKLYRFVEPLFPRAKHDKKRLIRAACLLHDVSWRAHPDYRAEVCFDNATRANLGGMTHAERVYLGLALLHRYKSSRVGTGFNTALLTLLPPEQVREAEILGRAMRFGAMFAVANLADHGTLTYRPKRRELILRLHTAAARDLFGEVALARFNALAAAMEVTPIIAAAR